MKLTNRFISDLKRYKSYAVYAAKASLKAEVAGSYLNWVWWILEPVCLMFIYAFIFGVIFDAREQYFTAFIFVGLAAWTFFNHCAKRHFTKGLRAKVHLYFGRHLYQWIQDGNFIPYCNRTHDFL